MRDLQLHVGADPAAWETGGRVGSESSRTDAVLHLSSTYSSPITPPYVLHSSAPPWESGWPDGHSSSSSSSSPGARRCTAWRESKAGPFLPFLAMLVFFAAVSERGLPTQLHWVPESSAVLRGCCSLA
ncbi:hypothetical protein EYF80_060082 [Liparis tanakae]|uniref:Uncharacterized protein n=1 Tax=Liparis tanakae TaxID=230148 RepID=A0A4Z2ELU7_9TELE|nr:hypothetical protein EYF80_060082 [Liparis tanakae]